MNIALKLDSFDIMDYNSKRLAEEMNQNKLKEKSDKRMPSVAKHFF
jgi:hypothetical protein